MFAEVGEQVLLGAELVSQFAGDKGRFVVATHCAAVCVELHFRVFRHGFQLCCNLKVVALKLLFKRIYSALIARNA